MGKRELLVILVFVILGVAVYQVSAPPAKGGGFSLGDFARRALREMRSENYNADHKSGATHPLPASVQEIRIRGVRQVAVIGEARADVASELVVSSSGVDRAEAEQLAAAAALTVDTTPEALTFDVEYPREGRQQASLTVRLPSRLRARIEEVRGEIRASDIAGVHLASTRGEITLTNITGSVEGDHRGGRLELTSGGSVRLTIRSADVRLRRVTGSTELDLTGGELKAGTLDGPLQIDARSTDIDVDSVAGPVKVNATGGAVTLGGLRQTVRCDGQHTDLRLTLAKPAPVTVFTTGGSLEVVAPPGGGVSVDAAATDGDVRVSGLDLPVRTDGRTTRAAGALAGGGPTVSLRSNNGTITVRAPSVPSP